MMVMLELQNPCNDEFSFVPFILYFSWIRPHYFTVPVPLNLTVKVHLELVFIALEVGLI